MTSADNSKQLIEITKLYFGKADVGDPSILDLFSDDVQLFFPKFGTRTGKAQVVEFVQGLMSKLESLKHDVGTYNFIASGQIVVVEGTESGVAKNGEHWPVEGKSDGRFCNVFEFSGTLISRLHIYVDPDFLGEDDDRFYWG
ncbi:Ketosteroid isomerase-related protein [Pseudomonas helmanticensis]|uniref:Ketosteroid isomerase-related protein n=1 Tax=Pseudomonas helmanticensis TaxID=1471381 RepID=A0ACD2UDI1_9PSED|nr:nuclear transport factor 2 family protein [Pseudomonas helmanticensis]SMQ30406.1 Ketosteroid isomerase-related protein [Pseudomonas helmanticensis]